MTDQDIDQQLAALVEQRNQIEAQIQELLRRATNTPPAWVNTNAAVKLTKGHYQKKDLYKLAALHPHINKKDADGRNLWDYNFIVALV